MLPQTKPAEFLDLCELQKNDSITYNVHNIEHRTYHGVVESVDAVNQIIILIDGMHVGFDDITNIFVS